MPGDRLEGVLARLEAVLAQVRLLDLIKNMLGDAELLNLPDGGKAQSDDLFVVARALFGEVDGQTDLAAPPQQSLCLCRNTHGPAAL